MKLNKAVIILMIPTLLMMGCNNDSSKQESKEQSSSGAEIIPDILDKDVNIYREKGVVDKTISLRFYKEYPNIPYIDPINYYQEFFNTKLTADINGSFYKYAKADDVYIGFDTKDDYILFSNLESFDYHPDYISSTGKLFLNIDSVTSTKQTPRTFSLKEYNIDLFENDHHAYVPFSLLNKFSGGQSLYNPFYNGKDIYVIDYDNQLGQGERDFYYYGEDLYEDYKDLTTLRKEDVAKYNYNELCFVVDNLRGYTVRLGFNDRDLFNLGLNRFLKKNHPKIKEYLLSLDKTKYLQGIYALFLGLDDGGHTGIIASYSPIRDVFSTVGEVEEFVPIVDAVANRNTHSYSCYSGFASYKRNFYEGFGDELSFCYKYDETNKTAFINFDSFSLDYKAWDDFYNGKGQIPVKTDTYAYIRNKLYQAKEDGAKNVVLDITTNGGGDFWTLAGLVGLLNKGKAADYMQDVVNEYTVTENFSIDLNLDGKFDEKDVEEGNKFDFNFGILTSFYSFSCANYFPFMAKELGFKTLGETTGGGSCAIAITSSADGLPFVYSSYTCLTTSSGKTVDFGAEADFPLQIKESDSFAIDCSDFYNIEKIANYLNSAYIN